MTELKSYTMREEKVNYLSHGLGVLIAVAATIILVQRSVEAHNIRAIFANSVYGFGMVLCMLSSTVYHYIQNPKTKKILRHFDHGSIYVLISASVTPLALVLLRNEGFWGWGLLIFVWLFALIGIGLSLVRIKANSHMKTASYVLMGLSILFAIKPLIHAAHLNDCVPVLYWMIAGGIFYIIGSLIYALSKREFSHSIFHVFVLLGLCSHIVAIFLVPLQ